MLLALPADSELLKAALDALKQKGYKHLPDLFKQQGQDQDSEQQRAYLQDVAVGAVDWLLNQISPESRYLLWLLTRALEAVSCSLTR